MDDDKKRFFHIVGNYVLPAVTAIAGAVTATMTGIVGYINFKNAEEEKKTK